MNFCVHKYKINYQYSVPGHVNAFNDLYSLESKYNDTYMTQGLSVCDAFNKLLDYCKKTGKTDIYVKSLEES